MDYEMDATVKGILNLNKSSGMTSRSLVDRVARLLPRIKVGHAGTLDPLASGVLILCVGSATRLIESVQCMTKVYRDDHSPRCPERHARRRRPRRDSGKPPHPQ